MLLALLASTLADTAEPCREALAPQWSVPAMDTTDVPLDSRFAVRFIGWGTEDDFSGRLTQNDQEIAGTERRWCYEHEGPHEVHCVWWFKPDEQLEAETEVKLVIESGELTMRQHFTTGTGLSLPVPDPPGAEVGDHWVESTGEDCDYETTDRYSFNVSGGNPDQDEFGLMHVYDDDGDIIHTVTTIAGEVLPDSGTPQELGMKQYVDARVEHSGCFGFTVENAAGEESEMTTACWEGRDSQDSADTQDSQPVVESDPPDSEAPTDSEPEEEPDRREPYTPEGCGCGASAGFFGIGLLLLTRRRD